MGSENFVESVAVIGAGPCGLTAGKNLMQAGFKVTVLEAADDIGGVWNFGKPQGRVYEHTHLISSKKMTEYTDFPFEDSDPDYPDHERVLKYLKDYAETFKLKEIIQFKSRVTNLKRAGDKWEITVNGNDIQIFDNVVVANGHLWDPFTPEVAQKFTGISLHSADYKERSILKDKRVLIVGAGNSGCDIAVEAGQLAKETYLSVRRGYHFIPKYTFGIPSDLFADKLARMPIPLGLRTKIQNSTLNLYMGDQSKLGLPKPDHGLFETHPIVNTLLPYFLGHGKVRVAPDIQDIREKTVIFKDGSEIEFDLIIWATGYNISFPFMEEDYANSKDGSPQLYLNLFHPKYDSLFFVGLLQTNSGLWGLADRQSQLIEFMIKSKKSPNRLSKKIRSDASQLKKVKTFNYVKSKRHTLAIEYATYRSILDKYNNKFRSVAL